MFVCFFFSCVFCMMWVCVYVHVALFSINIEIYRSFDESQNIHGDICFKCPLGRFLGIHLLRSTETVVFLARPNEKKKTHTNNKIKTNAVNGWMCQQNHRQKNKYQTTKGKSKMNTEVKQKKKTELTTEKCLIYVQPNEFFFYSIPILHELFHSILNPISVDFLIISIDLIFIKIYSTTWCGFEFGIFFFKILLRISFNEIDFILFFFFFGVQLN